MASPWSVLKIIFLLPLTKLMVSVVVEYSHDSKPVYKNDSTNLGPSKTRTAMLSTFSCMSFDSFGR